MFEVGQISDSARYAYNRENHQNSNKNNGLTFSEVLHTNGEFSETGTDTLYANDGINQDNEFVNIVDRGIYTLTGEIAHFRKFSGIFVDLKV